jgi:hypothetical protein
MTMALSGITATPSQTEPITPSALPLDENGKLEPSDPKSMVAQQIIERVFSARGKNDPENENAAQDAPNNPTDSVVISHESMERSTRSSGNATLSLPDGGTVRLSYETSEFARIEQTAQVQSSDPLILDLQGDNLNLTDVSQRQGVMFDLTGDGKKEQVSWVRPDDGLLAWDRNGNGRIDDGNELFGDQHGAVDGFAELARYDSDGNGVIDSNDPIFSELRVWQDHNQNGISETGELTGLTGHSINQISIRSHSASMTIAGNQITGYTELGTATGKGVMVEALLNYYA